MPRARGNRRGIRKGLPRWAVLLLGLALGVASVLLTQLVINRAGSSDGLAGLLAKTKHVEPPAPKRPEPIVAKPKLDFYTVLPEVETVLPDRGARTKSTKLERTEEGERYVLQAGSFANFDDADQLKAKLALQGLPSQIQKITIEGKGEYHRVRLGPYDRLDELDAVSQQLAKLGLKPIRLKVKKGTG
jgi:cell division protein FtsN